MTPKNITSKHILKAIREIDKNGVPKGRESKIYLNIIRSETEDGYQIAVFYNPNPDPEET